MKPFTQKVLNKKIEELQATIARLDGDIAEAEKHLENLRGERRSLVEVIGEMHEDIRAAG